MRTSSTYTDFLLVELKNYNMKLQKNRQNIIIDSLTASCMYDSLDYDFYFLRDLILKIPLLDLIFLISKPAKPCQKP